MATAREGNSNNENTSSTKKKVVNFCLEIAITLTFLTTKITVMTLIFAARDNTSALSWLFPGLTVLACSTAVWIIYLKSYHLEYIQDLSYRRLLTNLEYEEAA